MKLIYAESIVSYKNLILKNLFISPQKVRLRKEKLLEFIDSKIKEL